MRSAVPVLIVGAGPAGLTLAAELGRRHIPCLLVEEKPGTKTEPRAMGVGPRSMEHFRRWGIADKVIDAGVPRSQPTDIIYTTRLFGYELARFEAPSADALAARSPEMLERLPQIRYSPYYRTWCSQQFLEAVLRDYVATLPDIELRFGWRLDSFEPLDDGARVHLTEVATGAKASVDADYLAGCDGARSVIRKTLGIELDGRGTMGEVWGTHFRAPTLMDAIPHAPAVMFWAVAPGCSGVVYSLNGRDEWWMNKYFRADEPFSTIDPAAHLHAAIGADIPVEIISSQAYKANQLVADRFVAGRVFLVGDSAHLFVPPGGLGMNTAIDDAVNLAWKIAASVESWAGPGLLGSFDEERRPVGIRNTNRAADNYMDARRSFTAPSEIEDPGETGERTRDEWIPRVRKAGARQHSIAGAQLGICYDQSSICVTEPGVHSDDGEIPFKPSAAAGCRAQHAWLADGRSVLDLVGECYTLLRICAGELDTSAMETAAGRVGMPFTTVDIDEPHVVELFEAPLVLVRPDGHVAWRGQRAPDISGALIDRVRGAAPDRA
jgi:2-polyprenyl-6-methoxyphenol hydroxylase-like FAD-dependent oxidoreductase